MGTPFFDNMDDNLSLAAKAKEENEAESARKRGIMTAVFSTPDGRRALDILLTDLRFYDWPKGPGDRVLNEYAKFLIRERLGVGDTQPVTDAVIGCAETGAARGGNHG